MTNIILPKADTERKKDEARRAATERKRRQRAREAAVAEVEFIREEWAAFVSPDRLPQKAGCPRDRVRAMAVKELVDNAADAGAVPTLAQIDPDTWVVTDDGAGLDREHVLRYFAVNRPMIRTKLVRRPTRGAIGNGLRVVLGGTIASRGALTVESRGRRYLLGVDIAGRTGDTVVKEEGPSEVAVGTRVTVAFGPALPRGEDDGAMALLAIRCFGPAAEPMGSHPSWYDYEAFDELKRAAAPGTTVAQLAAMLGVEVDDPRPAAQAGFYDMRGHAGPPPRLLPFGRGFFPGHYAMEDAEPAEYRPYPVLTEAWAGAERGGGRGLGEVTLLVNRTPVAAPLHVWTISGRLAIVGCNLRHHVERVPTGAAYSVTLAVTSPFVPIVTDGKEPDLRPLWRAIEPALSTALRKAYAAAAPRNAPKGAIKDAAWQVMADAYKGAAGSRNRANARQIMYIGRRLMEPLLPPGTRVDDDYFTQTLLPDYIREHPKETAGWRVDYDDRGHIIEPHTGRIIPVGTASIEDYVARSRRERHAPGELVEVEDDLYPTWGPRRRFATALIVEKEGFIPLLLDARIEQRYDCAVIPSKGVSNTSMRAAVELFAREGVRVLVLHDFDRAGACIGYTICHDTRRYTFEVEPEVIDIGLTLAEARDMGLQDEAAPKEGPGEERLREYGLGEDEIDFLIRRGRRVELNAMTSDQFVDFVERKLREHGAGKVVPEAGVLEEHARRLLARRAVGAGVGELARRAQAEADAAELPADLPERVHGRLEDEPVLSWDDALEAALEGVTLGNGGPLADDPARGVT